MGSRCPGDAMHPSRSRLSGLLPSVTDEDDTANFDTSIAAPLEMVAGPRPTSSATLVDSAAYYAMEEHPPRARTPPKAQSPPFSSHSWWLWNAWTGGCTTLQCHMVEVEGEQPENAR